MVANEYALFPTWSELGVVDVLALERVLVRDFTAEWVQFAWEGVTKSLTPMAWVSPRDPLSRCA